MMSVNIPSAISSPESEDGVMPSGSQDGPMSGKCGLVPARANHLVVLENKRGKAIKDIFGPRGSGSSKSANLQSFLESRLRQQLPKGGLTMFIKGWRTKNTPLGRQ